MNSSSAKAKVLKDPPGTETRVSCTHCGLDVPGGRPELNEPQFCCTGCEAAFQLLHSSGLDAFYDYRQVEQSGPGRRAGVVETFEDFDDPAFEADYVTSLGERTRRADLVVEGLHCRACVWLLEQLPRLEPGVLESRLNMHRSTLTVTWDAAATQLSAVAQLLQRLGYFPHAASEGQAQQLERQEHRRRLTQIAIAAAIAGNLMIISISLYAGWASGMSEDVEHFFRWVSAGLGLLAVAGPGRSFFQQAWLGVRARVPNMDLPIAVGLGLGTVAGLVNTIRGTGEIYFDSLAMLILLLLVGRWIQYRQHRQAARMIHQLYELTPRRARRVELSGETRWVPVNALQVGDGIQLLAGETVPADGVVVQGESTIDRSLLTGESVPVVVTPGDTVFAGMINLGSGLQIRVTARGEGSRLGQLIDMIEGAAIRKTPIVQFADRLGGFFVVAILVLTAVTALGWRLAGDPDFVDHAIALAIVACPCALGLATPLAVAVAIGRAARRKLLIKGGDALEQLSRPGQIWLDKTGTLTVGKLQTLSWVGDTAIQPAVLALERHSAHPAARSLVDFLQAVVPQKPAVSAEVEGARQSDVGGIAGQWSGQPVAVGNLAFLESEQVEISAAWRRWARWVGRGGYSPILVARDKCVVAGAAVGDRIRPDSRQVIQRLQRLGWRVGILSGDHPMVVEAVASELGIANQDAIGGLLPEEKLAYIEQARRPGHVVVMVGDGMNDSVALAAADVGVSMKSSAEASLESADVHLGQEGVQPLCDLLVGAQQTVKTIRWALSASLAYNGVAVVLAAMGWVNPLLAAVLMPLSSLTVLSIALSGPAFRASRLQPQGEWLGSHWVAAPQGGE